MAPLQSTRAIRGTITPAGSATTTTTSIVSDTTPAHGSQTSHPRLQLLGEARSPEQHQGERRIRWTDDTIDNANMGKKKSKVCCIYHKARPAGESSSDESSSSSDNGSDSENDNGGARSSERRSRGHLHEHGHGRCSHDDTSQGADHDRQKGKEKKSQQKVINAYEKQPKASEPGNKIPDKS